MLAFDSIDYLRPGGRRTVPGSDSGVLFCWPRIYESRWTCEPLLLLLRVVGLPVVSCRIPRIQPEPRASNHLQLRWSVGKTSVR